jgi:hypothetical protein
MPSVEWYYARDNKQHGPVSAAELRQLATRGELAPTDLVWCEKLDSWTPARKVGGLFEEGAAAPPPPPTPAKAPPKPAPPAEAPPVFAKSEEDALAPSPKRPMRHVFDVVLDFARAQFTLQFVELTSRIFTLAGHYGLYLGMALLLVFSLLSGVMTNQVNTILLGATGVVILLVLQYAARRFFEAMERLNRSTPARMCSSAFLDCFALLNMFGGLVILLGLTVLAVQIGALSLVLPAIAAFILCQYLAVLALNPQSLNLTIASEATAGEEAIGVLSFLVKLGLRMVPVAFGVGVVWATLGLSFACFLVIAPPENPQGMMDSDGTAAMTPPATSEDSGASEAFLRMLPAQTSAINASLTLIAFAALPILTYVSFLVLYLTIDVLRAILAIPGKVGRLAKKDEGNDE